MGNRRILCIGDLHCPYHHRDAVAFLSKIKEVYDPDEVICIGDEVDSHSMSFHDSDPGLANAGEELKRAREVIWKIEELYPKVTVIESNHGSLAYRKAKVAGIPKEMLRPYEQILMTQKWKWVYDHKITLPNKQPVYFHHGKSANYLLAAQRMGMSFCQGHFHSKFGIQYWGNAERLNWSMAVGCLIDDESLAFAYNKTTMDRPVIGSGIIIDSQPRLIPMVLDRRGRWNRRIN